MADKVAVLVAGGEGAEREGEDRGAVAVTLLVRGEELDFDFIFQLFQLEFEFIFMFITELPDEKNPRSQKMLQD